jgi:hypothetical protein
MKPRLVRMSWSDLNHSYLEWILKDYFDLDKYHNPLTEQKMEHNYQLFYNRDRVVNGIKQELIEPMLEWINQ